MNNAKDIIDSMMNAYSKSSQSVDSQRMDIALSKNEYETSLNEMWRGLHFKKYKEQLDVIKSTGCKVYRDGVGKHLIKI